MAETYIKGKDQYLEKTISFFESKLQEKNINIIKIESLNSIRNVYSCIIQDRDCPYIYSNGKGNCELSAYASALGELFERLSTHYHFADFYLGEEIANFKFVHYQNEKWFPINYDNPNETINQILDSNIKDRYNIDDVDIESLIDLGSSNTDRGILTLPFIRQNDNQTVYVPINILDNLFASNGMSAGNTFFEAKVQALSEIIERNVKNRIIAGAISLPKIPNEVIEQYPKIHAAINDLKNNGYNIVCYDASLGGKYPVTCVTLFNTNNNTCYASFGAHPTFEIALERTVTELMQGRKINDFDNFSKPTFDIDLVASPENLENHFIDSSGVLSIDMFVKTPEFDFANWNYESTTEEEFKYLLNIIQSDGFDVYIYDCESLGVKTTRIIVPGFSEVYNPQELEETNNNIGSIYRDYILDLANLDKEDVDELLASLSENEISDTTLIGKFIGIAVNNTEYWDSFSIGEMKCLIALAQEELEAAEYWSNWVVQSNLTAGAKSSFYSCINNCLNVILGQEDLNEYQEVFANLYTETLLNKVLAHIKGEEKYYQYGLNNLSVSNIKEHSVLIDTYKKII